MGATLSQYCFEEDIVSVAIPEMRRRAKASNDASQFLFALLRFGVPFGADYFEAALLEGFCHRGGVGFGVRADYYVVQAAGITFEDEGWKLLLAQGLG
jgi:hypothetical protein